MSTPEATRDVLVIGAMGVLATWAADLLREACGRLDPPVEVREAGRDHEVADIGRADGAPRVLLVDFPTLAILSAVEAGRVSVVATVDDPVDSVRYTMGRRGITAIQALRDQTCRASLYYLCPGNPRVLLVRRGSAVAGAAVADAILAQAGLVLPAEAREAVRQAFCGPAAEGRTLEAALQGRVEGHLPLNQLSEAVPASDVTLFRQVLSPLVLSAISKDIGTIVWPARTFFFGDRPDEAPPPIVDLTGSARVIYYGPYFHIPPGLWHAKILLAFTDGANGLRFTLNVLSNMQVIARVELKPGGAGAFEGTFHLNHRAPHQNVEINLISQEATIDGHIALGQMTFTREEAAPPEALPARVRRRRGPASIGNDP